MACSVQVAPESDGDEPIAPQEDVYTQATLAHTSSSDSESEEETLKLPTATRSITASSIPIAVRILTEPGTFLKTENIATMLPQAFINYKGPGGEEIRALFHSMLAEYKTNVDDNYPTHGSLKLSFFVSFIDVCCAFVREPNEEICTIIARTARAFIKSIRILFKQDVYLSMESFAKKSAVSASVEDQVKVASSILNVDYDVDEICVPALDGVPLSFVAPELNASPHKTMNMFMILHRYASSRDTVVYTYAHFVRDKVTQSLMERNIFTAHIFLRYFIYTLTALCQLAAHDWHDTLKKVNNATDTTMEFLTYKISSALYSNFSDVCVFMMSKAYNYETKISAEYARFSMDSTAALSVPIHAASSSSLSRSAPAEMRKEPFMPKIDMGIEKPQGSDAWCAIS